MPYAKQAVSPTLRDTYTTARRFSPQERLLLAKWLLESVLAPDEEDEQDWSALGLAAFESEWDNPEDAIYDEWRKHYGLPAG